MSWSQFLKSRPFFVWILPGTSPPRALAGVVLAPTDVMWSNLLWLELRELLMSVSCEKFCENIMCCESVRASAPLHKDLLVVLARRFFAHAHSWDINIVMVFIHINSMLTHKTHANANNISTILILIMTITWVVPGHDEPLPILTRSLRRRCVARPGGIVVITCMGFHTHILVFIQFHDSCGSFSAYNSEEDKVYFISRSFA